jgi:acyl-CoA dehydrogenase
MVDQLKDYRRSRLYIAGVKVAMAKVLHDIVYRSMHVHGSLGVSNEMPLARMWMGAPVMGIADGPTEVHKVTISKLVLRDYKPSDGLFPSQHVPTRRASARARFAELLEHEVGNL